MRPDIGAPVTNDDVDKEFSHVSFGEAFEDKAAALLHQGQIEYDRLFTPSENAFSAGSPLNDYSTPETLNRLQAIAKQPAASPEQIKEITKDRPGLYLPPLATVSTAQRAADYYDKDLLNNAIAEQGKDASVGGWLGYYSGSAVGGLASPSMIPGIALGGLTAPAGAAIADIAPAALARLGIVDLAGQASAQTASKLAQVLGPAARRLAITEATAAGFGVGQQAGEEVGTYNQDQVLNQNYDFLKGAENLYTSTWNNMLWAGVLHGLGETIALPRALNRVNATFKDNNGDVSTGKPSNQEFVKNNYQAMDNSIIQNANVDALAQAQEHNIADQMALLKQAQFAAGQKFRASMAANNIDPKSLLEDLDKGDAQNAQDLQNWFQSYAMPANLPTLARSLADEAEQNPSGDFSTNAIIKAIQQRFPDKGTATELAQGADQILGDAKADVESRIKFVDTPIGKMIDDFKQRFNYANAPDDIQHFVGDNPLAADTVSQKALYKRAMKGEIGLKELPKEALARVKNDLNINRLRAKAKSLTDQYKKITPDLSTEIKKAFELANNKLFEKANPYLEKAKALVDNRIPHLDTEKEIENLRPVLFSGSDPRPQFASMKAYARLKELATAFNSARNMMMELNFKSPKHLENMYKDLWVRHGNELLTQKSILNSLRGHINDTHEPMTQDDFSRYIKQFNNPFPSPEETPAPRLASPGRDTDFYLNNYTPEQIQSLIKNADVTEAAAELEETTKNLKNQPIYKKMIDNLINCEVG